MFSSGFRNESLVAYQIKPPIQNYIILLIRTKCIGVVHIIKEVWKWGEFLSHNENLGFLGLKPMKVK